ncbi:MAG: DUF2625 domain-containing protein [Bacteroidota bacterium]|nr:MAG: DUF2625 domain-containing protein [Bacteroidota bacterium]QQS52873.1 MAG: DUF2625 domain-containing protein [Bacteroidota bacterium]QQS52877.1 MAG: DUF2625 domain-containing protein [Bacteroidota bacterium]
MRELKDLINTNEPGWELVSEWIGNATNKVEILPKDNDRADSALYQAQVTTRSPMGAIIYETGGIFVDNGWIRILGSGSQRLNRSLMEWNRNKTYRKFGEQLPFLLVADDVLGGFFAINAGGLDKNSIGQVFYFAPDNLTWENTNLSYSDFLIFCFQGDLNKFYKGYRWDNWIDDISKMDGNQGMHIIPFLWTKEGKDINNTSKKAVPIEELWGIYFDDRNNK